MNIVSFFTFSLELNFFPVFSQVEFIRFWPKYLPLVTLQAPRADRVSKIIVKSVEENFDNTCKQSYWLHLPFLYKSSTIRGGGLVPPFIWHLPLSCDILSKSYTFSKFAILVMNIYDSTNFKRNSFDRICPFWQRDSNWGLVDIPLISGTAWSIIMKYLPDIELNVRH